jgi:hypothetical protein
MFEEIKQFVNALDGSSAIKEKAVLDVLLSMGRVMADEDYRGFLFFCCAQKMIAHALLSECFRFAQLISGLDRADYLSTLTTDLFKAGHALEAKSLLSEARNATTVNDLPVEKSRALSSVAAAATEIGCPEQATEMWEEVVSVAGPAQTLSGVDGPECSSALMAAVKGFIRLGNCVRAKSVADSIRISSIRERALAIAQGAGGKT